MGFFITTTLNIVLGIIGGPDKDLAISRLKKVANASYLGTGGAATLVMVQAQNAVAAVAAEMLLRMASVE